MTEITSFKQECKEWLEPLNYSIHSSSHNSNEISITFTNYIDDNSPAIICCLHGNGEKKCKLVDSNYYKYFLSLQSGDLQFKHPDILRFIELFRYYSRLAQYNEPNLKELFKNL